MSRISIVSQNPTGILAAVLLQRAGHEVTVLDSGAGTWPAITKFNQQFLGPYELSAIPSEAIAFDALAQLETALDMRILAGEKEAAPIYFDGNEPKPFVGFGDAKFSSLLPLSSFNFSKSLALTQSLTSVLQRARESFTGEWLTYTEIAKLDFDGDKIANITLNSGKTLTADFVINCDSPRTFLNLIPADMVNARWRSRIFKAPAWSRIKIHFQHAEPICAPELIDRTIYLIPGGTQHEPFVGQVYSGTEGNFSVWQAFMGDETGEDAEMISSKIKFMRRQLQRAFGDFRREHLLMAEPEVYGDFSWAREGAGLKDDIHNAIVASPLFSPFNGLMSCVEQAHQAFLKISEPPQKRSKEPTILAENSATC